MKKLRRFIAFVLIVALCMLAGFMAVSARFPVRHLNTITQHAGELEPSLILAVIMAESSFNPDAVSRVGAQGLMQLMPATATDIANRMGKQDFDPSQVWDPDVNITMGVFYLNWLLARYNGNVELALAAYNAGLGNVDSWLRDPELSNDGKTLNRIPFPETYNYLRRIQQFQRIYRVLLFVR